MHSCAAWRRVLRVCLRKVVDQAFLRRIRASNYPVTGRGHASSEYTYPTFPDNLSRRKLKYMRPFALFFPLVAVRRTSVEFVLWSEGLQRKARIDTRDMCSSQVAMSDAILRYSSSERDGGRVACRRPVCLCILEACSIPTWVLRRTLADTALLI